jgi:hypothetical protein
MPFETIERDTPQAVASTAGEVREQLRLLGQPTLRDHLDFVQHSVAGGAEMDPRAVCDEWRLANDRYYDLEKREAGIADKAECLELPAAMRPLADELAALPSFRNTWDCLPVSFGMVELDRLVLYQRHVTLPFVEALAARLTPPPDAEGLFRFCQPLERSDPPISVRRLDEERYLFASESTDFRFHKAVLLRPEQIVGFESFGPIGAVVGLVVGFGSNFLSVIRSDGRMLLHNGYHRAYALRAAGFTHAPAVIQTVTRLDELALVAAHRVVDEPGFYFAAKRPPLLKDFFDPQLSKVLPVRRRERLIEVSFDYDEMNVPLG